MITTDYFKFEQQHQQQCQVMCSLDVSLKNEHQSNQIKIDLNLDTIIGAETTINVCKNYVKIL